MSKLKGFTQQGLNHGQENTLSSQELAVSTEINQVNSTPLENTSEQNRLIPPTEPSQQIPPTDPYDEPVLPPPTDPGLILVASNNFDDEQDLIPPTDPGEELSIIPPTDPEMTCSWLLLPIIPMDLRRLHRLHWLSIKLITQ